MHKRKIYPVGSFSGWRDQFINELPEFEFDDPRDHPQSAVAKFDTSDMNSAANCPITLAYIAKDTRLGTTSYCELGASRANGNCIIAADENEKKDSLIRKIASHHYSSSEGAIQLLKEKAYASKYNSIKRIDKTKSKKTYESVLFVGDNESTDGLEDSLERNGKKVIRRMGVENLDNFSNEVDLVVVNFDKGKEYDKYGLFFLGLGYACDVPVLELEGNVIIYPSLPGLARRTLVGKNRFKQAEFYLKNLKSQRVEDESKVYFELRQNFNK